jgi:xanthine/uracil/vitamin C permease (AzgA family)
MILIPLTFSVAEGLGGGLMLYTLLSCLTQKARKNFNQKTIWLTSLLAAFILFFHLT